MFRRRVETDAGRVVERMRVEKKIDTRRKEKWSSLIGIQRMLNGLSEWAPALRPQAFPLSLSRQKVKQSVQRSHPVHNLARLMKFTRTLSQSQPHGVSSTGHIYGPCFSSASCCLFFLHYLLQHPVVVVSESHFFSCLCVCSPWFTWVYLRTC